MIIYRCDSCKQEFNEPIVSNIANQHIYVGHMNIDVSFRCTQNPQMCDNTKDLCEHCLGATLALALTNKYGKATRPPS